MQFRQPTLIVNETTGMSTKSLFVRTNIAEVVNSHTVDGIEIDTDCLVKVCLGCGSIASTADRENRDRLASWYDFECHANQTYSFVSHSAGVTQMEGFGPLV